MAHFESLSMDRLMSINKEKYKEIIAELKDKATLIAVSKTKTAEDIKCLYDEGQRDFGENYVQELVDKKEALPKDIRWHFIGHLQSNKVKYVAPFVHLIHSVDSNSLLKEIDRQAAKNYRIINCLLQVHISSEETKFGFDETVLSQMQIAGYTNVQIKGLMGMASFSDDANLLRNEFKKLKILYDQLSISHPKFSTLSMGMSGDYKIAMQQGSNMVRIGSLLFGERDYSK